MAIPTSTFRSAICLESEDPQSSSLLFQLPGELRDRIYDFALAASEDKSQQYDSNTYWARPQYSAPRKSDLALLRTCRKAYREAWFKSWSLADHSFWLTGHDRAPRTAVTLDRFVNALRHVYEYQGHTEIEHVRFFAQMYVLESGSLLPRFLNTEHFHPKAITITIRHTDWWFWEDDAYLRISSMVTQNIFPASVRSIALELETLERKKNQVDSIVSQMKSSWYFATTEGILSAQDTPVEIERWRGSSTWAGERWIRDEIAPGCVDYCKSRASRNSTSC